MKDQEATHSGETTVPSVPGYEKLRDVLERAYNQASIGKGSERHSVGQPFHEQPIVALQRLYGPGYAYGQVGKKMEEALRLPIDQAIAELLGGIVYLAAAVIRIEETASQSPATANHQPESPFYAHRTCPNFGGLCSCDPGECRGVETSLPMAAKAGAHGQ